MKPLEECLLYAFVDWDWLNDRDPLSVAEQLIEGGADIIQLRAKKVDPALLLPMARRIYAVTERADVPLVINDHLSMAKEIGADLCHLGQEDFFESGKLTVSDLNPGPVKIGLSTHSPEQAARSLRAGPAYIAIGPVFQTPTKPSAPAVTLQYVRWAAKNVTIPWFAIGGIKLENLEEVIEAGARRICVVSGILNSSNIVKACQSFKKPLLSAAKK